MGNIQQKRIEQLEGIDHIKSLSYPSESLSGPIGESFTSFNVDGLGSVMMCVEESKKIMPIDAREWDLHFQCEYKDEKIDVVLYTCNSGQKLSDLMGVISEYLTKYGATALVDVLPEAEREKLKL